MYDLLSNNIEEFDNLLKQQPNITNSLRDGFYERTLLMKGARKRDKPIVSLLSKNDHDLSVVNDNGRNVLHWIVLYNYDDDSFELLNLFDATQLASVINQQNKYNETPLHDAAWSNLHKTIVWLLEHGADPSVKDNRGERPGEQYRCNDETKRIIQFFRK